MMNWHVHGTTDICVPCEGGFIIGNDARISSSYVLNGQNCVDIITDEEVKLFQLCCEPNMYCTLMGDVYEWHEMFKHFRGKEPKSMEEAAKVASEYLKNYRVTKKKTEFKGTEFKEIGTIIVGYEEEEGFQCCGLTASSVKVDYNKGPILAIGSGSRSAKKILRKREDCPTMTRQDAVSVTLRALMEACFDDISTGVLLKVTFVHNNGCISDTYQLLEVYSAMYEPSTEEKATLFLIHSTSTGLIFGDDDINNLVGDLWSDLNLKQFRKYNVIAKKACFYVIRIVLYNENDAAAVYAHLRNKNNKPLFPKALAHLSSYLIDCIRQTFLDHIYVGRSSKDLLEGLKMLKDADNLKYQ